MGKIVLAISGSLRKPSFTEKMLDLCLEGMGDGLEVHKFYPHKMTIGPCTGCWTCWLRTPGECALKDDFQQIIDVYLRADYLLIAAPLYYSGFPATVKNVIDRFFVMLEPSQHRSARGDTQHPTRHGRHPKTVLISSCGFPEAGNFDLIRAHFRRICEHMEWAWSGEILIPAAGAAKAPGLFDATLGFVKQAGAELAKGSISTSTTEAIIKPLVPAEDYRQMCTSSLAKALQRANPSEDRQPH
jgi:hypothetical protein